ncbi:ABC transporter permease subunit [Aliagarivorans marinus]|uniref:ABC transporter permease subunit n=1 Tax=Aliagarivorans marinus TaxID=561965 RepID=UPI00040FBDF6|nr:ABC transporter permease subunit [Aliagarivorans marinus]
MTSNSLPMDALSEMPESAEATKPSIKKPAPAVTTSSNGRELTPFAQMIVRQLNKLQKGSPVASGEYYGQPGAGDSRIIALFSTLFFIGLWALVTETGMVRPLFLPSPVDVVARMVDITLDGFSGATLGQHLAASLGRIFGSFALACLIGIPLGVAIGCSRVMRGIFDPLIEFYRPLPPLAYLPLVIIWMGIDESSKIMLIFLAMLAPVVLSARAGVSSVKIEQIQVAYSMGASRWQVVTQVILHGALPDILTGMRIAIGFGWTTLVAAEMVAAERGIGFMVLNASEFLVTDVVIAGIVIIGVIAYLFDMLMRYMETKLVPWKGQI